MQITQMLEWISTQQIRRVGCEEQNLGLLICHRLEGVMAESSVDSDHGRSQTVC